MSINYVQNGGAENSLVGWTTTNVSVATGEFSANCFALSGSAVMEQSFIMPIPITIQAAQLKLLVKNVVGIFDGSEILCPVMATARLTFDNAEAQIINIPMFPAYDIAVNVPIGTGWIGYASSITQIDGSVLNGFTVTIKTDGTTAVKVDDIQLIVFDDLDAKVEEIATTTTSILNSTNGYVKIRQRDGVDNEILIMDSPNMAEAIKIWRWNLSGLGYSDDGIGVDDPDRTYKTAIDMDGNIYGNLIKAGTISADAILGGILTLGGAESSYGRFLMKDDMGADWVAWNSIDGFRMGRGDWANTAFRIRDYDITDNGIPSNSRETIFDMNTLSFSKSYNTPSVGGGYSATGARVQPYFSSDSVVGLDVVLLNVAASGGIGSNTMRIYRDADDIVKITDLIGAGITFDQTPKVGVNEVWHAGNSDFLTAPTLIPAYANLDDYKTPGMFYTPSSGDAHTMVNTPDGVTTSSFSILVEKHAGVKQTLTEYNTTNLARVWTRNYYNGTWGSWYRIWDERNFDLANVIMHKGAVTVDFNNYTDTGKYSLSINSPTTIANAPYGTTGIYGSLMVYNRSSSHVFQEFRRSGLHTIYIRESLDNGATWTAWVSLVTTPEAPLAFTQTYATADRTVAAQTAAALTNSTGGTVGTTLAAITAGTSYAQADMTAVKNALASLADQHNKLRTDHVDTLQALNAIIDILQAVGLAS